MNKFLVVFGTRPELIKLAPVINEFRKRNRREQLFIVNTNQHKHILAEDLEYFAIETDYQFDFERKSACLNELSGLLMLGFSNLKAELKNTSVSAVIAQGDTCSTFAAAMFAFYEKIPFLHIEAGLRTHDFGQPFPEEFFRKTISSLSSFHFAPTQTALNNLVAEGIESATILMSGNTVIDNLREYTQNRSHKEENFIKQQVIITIHRRENIAENLSRISNRITAYCLANPDKEFVWIDNPGFKIEPDIEMKPQNLKFIQPLSFSKMMQLYKSTMLIITDSGGIQEEAAYLGIPVLVFRTVTERPESIQSGISKYISDANSCLNAEISELNRNRIYNSNALYGDGYSSARIVDFIDNQFNTSNNLG